MPPPVACHCTSRLKSPWADRSVSTARSIPSSMRRGAPREARARAHDTSRALVRVAKSGFRILSFIDHPRHHRPKEGKKKGQSRRFLSRRNGNRSPIRQPEAEAVPIAEAAAQKSKRTPRDSRERNPAASPPPSRKAESIAARPHRFSSSVRIPPAASKIHLLRSGCFLSPPTTAGVRPR